MKLFKGLWGKFSTVKLPTKKFENGINGQTIKTRRSIKADFTDKNSTVTTSGDFNGILISGNSNVNAGGDINVTNINQSTTSSQGNTISSLVMGSNISTEKDAFIKTAIQTDIKAKGDVIIDKSLNKSNVIAKGNADISNRLVNSTVAAKGVTINNCEVEGANLICETIDAKASTAKNTFIAQYLCGGAFKISKIGDEKTPLDFTSIAEQPSIRIDLHDPKNTIAALNEITKKGWDISPETLRTMARTVATTDMDILVKQLYVNSAITAYENVKNGTDKLQCGIIATNPNLKKEEGPFQEIMDMFNKENGTGFVVFELTIGRQR